MVGCFLLTNHLVIQAVTFLGWLSDHVTRTQGVKLRDGMKFGHDLNHLVDCYFFSRDVFLLTTQPTNQPFIASRKEPQRTNTTNTTTSFVATNLLLGQCFRLEMAGKRQPTPQINVAHPPEISGLMIRAYENRWFPLRRSY